VSPAGHDITVLFCSHHNLLRRAVCELLAGQQGVRLVGEVCELRHLKGALRTKSPDVLLLDLDWPDEEGCLFLPDLAGQGWKGRTVVMSLLASRGVLLRAFGRGARGFLLKTEPASHILAAVRAAARGDYFLGSERVLDFLGSSLQCLRQSVQAAGYRLQTPVSLPPGGRPEQ